MRSLSGDVTLLITSYPLGWVRAVMVSAACLQPGLDHHLLPFQQAGACTKKVNGYVDCQSLLMNKRVLRTQGHKGDSEQEGSRGVQLHRQTREHVKELDSCLRHTMN